MKKLILASGSPRRRQLLTQIGLQFEVDVSNIDEIVNPKLKPEDQVKLFSLQKAEAIVPKYTDAVILAADSMVAIGDEVLGKPKDKNHAIEMLKKISGTKHQIITAFTLIDAASGKTVTKVSRLSLWFKELSEKDIEWLLERDKPYDKAGAYAIQESTAVFIEKFEGDYFGGIGLPLFSLAKELEAFGIKVI